MVCSIFYALQGALNRLVVTVLSNKFNSLLNFTWNTINFDKRRIFQAYTENTDPEYLIVNNGVSQRSGFESQQAWIFSGFLFASGYSYVVTVMIFFAFIFSTSCSNIWNSHNYHFKIIKIMYLSSKELQRYILRRCPSKNRPLNFAWKMILPETLSSERLLRGYN